MLATVKVFADRQAIKARFTAYMLSTLCALSLLRCDTASAGCDNQPNTVNLCPFWGDSPTVLEIGQTIQGAVAGINNLKSSAVTVHWSFVNTTPGGSFPEGEGDQPLPPCGCQGNGYWYFGTSFYASKCGLYNALFTTNFGNASAAVQVVCPSNNNLCACFSVSQAGEGDGHNAVISAPQLGPGSFTFIPHCHGSISEYRWDFGDGFSLSTSDSTAVNHSYPDSVTADYWATLTITGCDGNGPCDTLSTSSTGPAKVHIVRPVSVYPSVSPGLGLRAFPNPAHGVVTVEFDMAGDEAVSVAAFDLAGHKVATLATGAFSAGRHVTAWNMAGRKAVPPGMYFVELRTVAGKRVRPVIIIPD